MGTPIVSILVVGVKRRFGRSTSNGFWSSCRAYYLLQQVTLRPPLPPLDGDYSRRGPAVLLRFPRARSTILLQVNKHIFETFLLTIMSVIDSSSKTAILALMEPMVEPGL